MILHCLFLVLALLLILALFFRFHRSGIVTFFHPNCFAGGGGERVLWAAILAISDKFPEIGIFSDGSSDLETLSEKIKSQFGFDSLPSNLRFFNVGPATFLLPNRFPHFTLLLQAFYSMIYALKCLFIVVPRVVIDTTGAPFAAPIWKLFGGCRVVLYTHYPFISTDMLSDVENQRCSVNNAENIKASKLKTRIKVLYYRIMCRLYGVTGKFVDQCFVNSSWTKGHIEAIYGREPTLLYPPCDCAALSEAAEGPKKKNRVISVGQYRPEKNHELQLDVMRKLKEKGSDAKLYIVGGVRDATDQALADSLQAAITEQQLNVRLKQNLPFDRLKYLYRKASVGIHAMRNEHFGICVVEYVAAGLLPIAHNSAGPRDDILKNEPDYLAETAEEYAQKILRALSLKDDERENETRRLQSQIRQFDTSEFQRRFRNELLGTNDPPKDSN
jgi:alpha-1,2-mannosyltransferase